VGTGLKQNWRRLAPGILISAASLVIILYFIDLDRLIEALRLADYRFVALLFGVTILWLAVRSLVWRTLLKEQASFSQVFFTLNEGYLLNNLLPFRLGEVGRAFLLAKKAKLKFLQVFSTILIERALDVAMAVGLLLTTLPFVVQTSLGWQVALVTGGLVLFGLGLLYLLARNQSWALKRFDALGQRFSILKRVLKEQHLAAFFSGLEALTDGKRFFLVILLMFLNWGVALLQFFLLVRAFFPEAQLLWGAFTLSVMALGIAVPSSPGGIGVMEVSIMGALSAFNLDPSASLAAALTAHLCNYLITGIFGVFALARDGMTITGLYRDVSQISQAGQGRVN